MQLRWALHANPIYDATSPLYKDLSSQFSFTQASFGTLAQGGFGDGTLDVEQPSEEDVRDAVRNWMLKRVVATDRSGRWAYEGYVAEIDAQAGYHSYHRTVDGFANRLFGEYEYAGNPCPRKATCRGRVQRNESDVAVTTTQADWGIFEDVYDITHKGVITQAAAQTETDNELIKKLNARAIDIRLEEQVPEPSLTLTLWGYWSTLKRRRFSYKYVTPTEVATIVQAALNSKGQFINTTDLSQVAATGITIKFNDDGSPWWTQDYILEAIKDYKLFFQIWENRQPFLIARSTSPKYFSRSDDRKFYDSGHAVVPDYMVRAGGIVVAENADFALDNYADAINRPYTSLIESTTYDDVSETLSIPASTEVRMGAARLLASVRNQIRNRV